MERFAVILGSTRPNRRGEPVARWVLEISSQREDAEFELVDLRDYPLPHLDEPLPPRLRQYQNEHTKEWSETIASFDGFVVAEYNSGAAGVLKNALDYLFEEWRNKAIGFVSYGSMGGARAVQQLRLVAGELEMADVREQVALSLFTDFDGDGSFTPNEHHIGALTTMLDQVISWSAALACLRDPQVAGAGGVRRSL